MGHLQSSPVTTPAAGGRVRAVARAYADHLLAGGVTPWPDFLASPAGPADEPSWSGEPPGAPQAELLRRLNRRGGQGGRQGGGQGGPPRRDLGERVLRRAAPGRGMVDVRLTDPPVDVLDSELLRVGAGVLADLAGELPVVGHRVGTGVVRPPVAPGAPSYRLEGPPLTVAALRRRLVAAGLPPSGARRWRLRRRPDVVLVVALPLRRALFEVWSRRTQRGATRSWSRALGAWHSASRLPAGAAYDRVAAGWAARVGASRVHVLSGDDLDRQAAAVLGRPPAPAPAHRPAGRGPADLSPELVEVVRRTSEVLTFRAPGEDKQERLERLVAVLPRSGRRAPAAPQPHHGWLRRTGRRTAARLAAGGYVVHGPLPPLGRVGQPARPQRLRNRAVLRAMLDSVLRADDARTGAARGRGQAT